MKYGVGKYKEISKHFPWTSKADIKTATQRLLNIQAVGLFHGIRCQASRVECYFTTIQKKETRCKGGRWQYKWENPEQFEYWHNYFTQEFTVDKEPNEIPKPGVSRVGFDENNWEHLCKYENELVCMLKFVKSLKK